MVALRIALDIPEGHSKPHCICPRSHGGLKSAGKIADTPSPDKISSGSENHGAMHIHGSL